MFNCIIIEGRLIRNLEILNLPNNQDPNIIGCKFSIANDYKKDVVLFFDVYYIGKKGITPYLKQGSAVIIRGKFQYSDYQKADGTKRRAYRIIAEDISFSMSNCGNGNNNNMQASSQPWQYQKKPDQNPWQNTNNQNYQSQNTQNTQPQNNQQMATNDFNRFENTQDDNEEPIPF